jgi:hypothetical protein
MVEQGRIARVLRGGSWYNNPNNCRSAFRNRNERDNRNNNIGCRVCFRLHGHWSLAWTITQNERDFIIPAGVVLGRPDPDPVLRTGGDTHRGRKTWAGAVW